MMVAETFGTGGVYRCKRPNATTPQLPTKTQPPSPKPLELGSWGLIGNCGVVKLRS
jgi:hypothetical protein